MPGRTKSRATAAETNAGDSSMEDAPPTSAQRVEESQESAQAMEEDAPESNGSGQGDEPEEEQPEPQRVRAVSENGTRFLQP